MSVKTLYICDKCGGVQETADQFWTVGVTANHGMHLEARNFYVKDKHVQVCRPCLESFGIHVMQKPSDPPKPQLPTVEELIREIISLVQEGE
jgi:hypothetical protein